MIVVDTSVVVQWLVPEDDSAAADLLLGQDELAAPDILLVETANVLRKKLRDGLIAGEQVTEGFAFLRSRIGTLVPFGELLERAFAMAVEVGHPVYDCMFLACAESLEGVLVTRDAKFVARASASHSQLLQLFTAEWARSLK